MAYSNKLSYGAEARLALGLQEYLKKNGFSTYPELDRVDIVAKKGEEVIAIECKMKLNLEVMSQAWAARKKATGIYIAVPGKSYYGGEGWEVQHFTGDVCLQMGIGLYIVTYEYHAARQWETWKPGDPVPQAKVTMKYASGTFSRLDTSWDALMVPEGETYSVAGGSGVKAWTAHRIWELEVKKWVQENPGKNCRDILQALRPPGVHKKTGKPLVVHKQDIERLYYFIRHSFSGFEVQNWGPDFLTSRIYTTEAYYDLVNTGKLEHEV